jgi:peptidoglycan/LPS O-acetylase OafA/YrhL
MQEKKKSSGVYFPGLNSLRFFAAATVWFVHAVVVLADFGLPLVIKRGMLHPDTGKLAVIFFFVLSGFLITYLLLTEKDRSGKISVGKFYIRRSLRIWPIYYLMVILGFFVFPGLLYPQVVDPEYNQNFTLYALLLPNFAGFVPIIGHFWSLGAEEQFYLIWPWLNKMFRNTYFLCLAIVVLQWSALALLQDFSVVNILAFSRFDCMATGGIFAAILFNNVKPLLRIIMWRGTLVVTLAILIILYWQHFRHVVYGYTVFGILFAIVIINVAANPRSYLKLDWRWTEYLGRISYGIYVYHFLAIYLVGIGMATFFEPINFPVAAAWLTIAVTGLLTVAISALSYNYFEKMFLKIKTRFTIVASGD